MTKVRKMNLYELKFDWNATSDKLPNSTKYEKYVRFE